MLQAVMPGLTPKVIKRLEQFLTICFEGNLRTCTRFALAKSIADGMMREIFVSERKIDIDQDQIKTALLNVHKVSHLTATVTISFIPRTSWGNGRTSSRTRLTSCRTRSPTIGRFHSPWRRRTRSPSLQT